MKWLIESSIRFRGLAVAAAVALLVLGTTQLLNAPVDALPEFQPTVVEVQTEALGLSAEEVEQFVTVPLEQDLLNGVAFLEDIESVSMPGLSSVVLTFEPGTDILDARQVVNERLTQAVGVAGLPEVASPPQMIQPLSSTNRVAIVRLTPQELTPIQTSVLARWVIGPRLLGVEGVANVAIFGQRERQLQILVDPARLEREGVSLDQIIRSSGNALEVSPLTFLEASSPGTGGFIDTVNQRFQVFHEQTIRTADELALVPLEDEDGTAFFVDGAPVTLGEVAEIVEGHQPLIGDALCSDGDCQLLVIEKFPGADTSAVATGLEEAVTAMRPGLEGMAIDTSIFRPADYIDAATGNLRTAVLIGLVLALAAIGGLLLNWRSMAVAAVVLAVSLATAFVILGVLGVTLNVMLLAGLTIGLLVVIEDVMLDTERLAGRLSATDDTGDVPLERRIRHAMMDRRSAALFGAFIVGAAIVPFLFMRGVGGAFLPSILAGYVLAMLVSLAAALLLTPAVSSLILDGPRSSPVVRAIHRGYDGRIAGRITSIGLAVGVLVVVVGLGAAALAFLRPSLDPALEERDVLVAMEAAPGISLTAITQRTEAVVAELADVPGVRTVGAHVGRAVFSDQVANVNEAEIWVGIDATADYDRALDGIRAVAAEQTDLLTDVTTHSQQRVDEVLGRTEQDIVVRVYGENPAVLEEKSAEIELAMRRVDGIADLRIDVQPEEQALQVMVDLGPAQAVGLKPGDVRRQAAILLNGITVGNLFDEQKVFDVVVWGTPAIRQTPETVRDLLIETEAFGRVRLDQVATVSAEPSPAAIRHESVFTYLDVTANVAGRSVTDVAAEVDAVVAGVDFPLEHHAELLGTFAERRSQQVLMTALWIGTAIFVFLLLQAALNSWKLAAGLFPVVAGAVGGGLVAAWVTGGSMGLGSIAALVVVFGFAIRESVVTIREYQRLQREGGRPFGPDVVVQGTRSRLAALITTAVAVVLFLLPIAIRGPSIGFEIAQPMAVVAIGGVIATTLLVVLALPALYLTLGDPEDAVIWGEELFGISLTDIEEQMEVES